MISSRGGSMIVSISSSGSSNPVHWKLKCMSPRHSMATKPEAKRQKTGQSGGSAGVNPAAPQGEQAVLPCPLPTLDMEDDGDVSRNVALMQHFVISRLALISKARPEYRMLKPVELQPREWAALGITAKSSAAEISSFKPPWSVSDAVTSLKTNGLYEASGNLLAVNPHLPDDEHERVIAGSLPSWKQVQMIAQQFFGKDCGAAVQVASPAQSQGEQLTPVRITFPVTVSVHIDAPEDAENKKVSTALPLLCGHTFVAAWYWAAFQAIQQDSFPWLLSLVQAALTVTIHCRSNLTKESRAIWTSQLSESHKAEHLFADSFMAFAQKVSFITKNMQNKVCGLRKANMRFNGAEVSKAMMTGILVFEEKMTPSSMLILQEIEQKFGQEALTKSATKISRISGIIAGRHSSIAQQEAKTLMEYFLGFLFFALKMEFITPKTLILEWLDKDKDGKFGSVHYTIAKFEIFQRVRQEVAVVMSDQADSSKEHMRDVLNLLDTAFVNYKVFQQSFPEAEEDPAALQGDDSAGDPLVEMKKKFKSNLSHVIIDFSTICYLAPTTQSSLMFCRASRRMFLSRTRRTCRKLSGQMSKSLRRSGRFGECSICRPFRSA